MTPGATIGTGNKSSLQTFIAYLRQFLTQQPAKSLLLTMLFVAALVAINYTLGIERRILALKPWTLSLAAFFLFYGAVLTLVWGLQQPLTFNRNSFRISGARWLLALASFYFSCKMIRWNFSPLFPESLSPVWGRYATIVLQLPAKLLLLLAMIYGCWKSGLLKAPDNTLQRRLSEGSPWQSVGLTRQGFNARPYFILLLFLIPVIGLASTQSDFLHFYPKFRNLAFINGYAHPSWPWKLLYELSYGLDFLSIELFFRGFLVIGLARWAGPKAILPMAAFYCTVHFGKPLGECITSFFGGLVLGVLAARTRSILGGLMVHLGLAWMMELGGWLGNIILFSNS
jgi:hypothetical protein